MRKNKNEAPESGSLIFFSYRVVFLVLLNVISNPITNL